MKIVVVGAGVEDSRTPAWGAVVRSLRHRGHDVFAFDPWEAERLAVRGTPGDQAEWVLAQQAPERIILLPSGNPLEVAIRDFAAGGGSELVTLNVEELSSGECDRAPGWFAGGAPQLETAPSRVDVVAMGDHSPEREAWALALVEAGIDLRVYGTGWGDLPAFWKRAMSPVPYSFLPQVFEASNVFVVWPDSVERELAVGPVHGALAAAAAGLTVVDPAGRLPEGVAHVSGGELVEQVRTASRSTNAVSPSVSALEWTVRWDELLSGAPSPRVHVKGPRVTYMTAAYNIESYIGIAIDSVLAQTVDDIEIIVMIDGATDGSKSEVEKRMSDPRVRMIEQRNAGQMGRFDWIFGGTLAEARGDYIALLGGDDVALPDRTERCLGVFEADPKAWLVHGGGIQIDAEGTRHGAMFTPDFSYDTSNLLRRAIGCNPIADPTAMFRRDVAEAVGGYNSGFACDANLWLKLARVGRVRYLPAPLSEYRVHDSNSSVGAGLGKAIEQGSMIRVHERERSGIVDLYPGLRDVDESDARAWTAAYMDMGNVWMLWSPLPEMALAEYHRAIEVCGDTVPNLHMAVARALTFAGSAAESMVAQNRALAADASLQRFAGTQVPASEVSSRPFELAPRRAAETICWDGTPASVRRMLVLPDWSRPETWWPVVEAYVANFDGGDDIDLALPTLGHDVQAVAGAFMSMVPASMDLDAAASITIEEWAMPEFIPVSRFAGIVDTRAGVDMNRVRALFAAARESLTV